jgi:hypothetical protein
MRGAYISYIKSKGLGRYSSAVEEVKAKHKEACELRLARIQNNAEPSHKNGHPKSAEKGA